MRFLFITDNKINGFGGGSLGSRKYSDALQNYCDKYHHDLAIISLDNNLRNRFSLEVSKTRKSDVIARLQGHSTYLYYVLEKQLKNIVKYQPDFVFLGRTRLGFVAKYLKKLVPNILIITFVENVEWDYVDSYFARQTGILGKIVKKMEKYVVWRDEMDAISYSDKLVYLTKRDYLRLGNLYNYQDSRPLILPVCLPHKQSLKLKSSTKNIVFIGSLNYDANIMAIREFVKKIWIPFSKTNDSVTLIIAGTNPTREIKKMIKEVANLMLVQNFNDVGDFVPRNSFMIAPIVKGSGMKVKVAETLSMGLMIAASDEALVGYEDALKDDHLNGIIRANTVDEYKEALSIYLDMSTEQLTRIEKQNIDIFNRYYSFDRSRYIIEKMIEEMER